MYTNLINSDSCQAAARVSHCCPCTPSLTSFRGKKSALCSVKVGLIISYSCLMNRSHILSCADVLFRMSYTYLKDSLLISMSMHCPDAHVFPHDFFLSMSVFGQLIVLYLLALGFAARDVLINRIWKPHVARSQESNQDGHGQLGDNCPVENY